jgi:hypothetical protein
MAEMARYEYDSLYDHETLSPTGRWVKYADHARIVADLRRGSCEVCWTNSWEPIARKEDADGVNTIGPDNLARCGFCWHQQAWQKKIAELEAKLKTVQDNTLRLLGGGEP